MEQQFLIQSGKFVGAFKHVGPDDQETLRIELISDEAVNTSAIEGEILNRDSVQSSLRHQFGLGAEKPGIKPAEGGISEMMADLYRNFGKPLDDATAKAKFHEKFRERLNERQEKVVARMFKEGIDGFEGGLSAENYIAISKTSRATATRDLQDLTEKGALTKTGALRHTRYFLNLAERR